MSKCLHKPVKTRNLCVTTNLVYPHKVRQKFATLPYYVGK